MNSASQNRVDGAISSSGMVNVPPIYPRHCVGDFAYSLVVRFYKYIDNDYLTVTFLSPPQFHDDDGH